MQRFLVRLSVMGVVLGALAVVEATAPAGAAVPCAVTAQRSSTPSGDAAWDPVLSADGSVTFFVSDANIGGQNPGGNNELWRRVGNVTTKLTSNPDDVDIERPDASADGTRVVFASEADLNGSNSDGNEEIWLWDLAGNPQLDALTQSEGAGNERPRISADGSRIVFQSTQDWDGENPDGNEEVFLRQIGQGAVQISPGSTGGSGSKKPSISGDGDVIVYESDRNPLGQNADGNLELFRYVVSTDTTTQITNTTPGAGQQVWQGNYLPMVDGDGSTVAFETEVAHGSLNADLEYVVMKWDNGTLTEIEQEAYEASISADGTRIAYLSSANIADRNIDGNDEVFVHHNRAIRQVTRTTGADVEVPRISRNGNHIAFDAEQNLLTSNADHSFEVFVATCTPVLNCDGQVVTIVAIGPADGRSSNDVFYGSPRRDSVRGFGGNDVFCGFGGDDGFQGGIGNDRFLGGDGNDFAQGGYGADVLKGQGGADSLDGGTGPTQLPENDVCDGGPGTDSARLCEHRLNIP